MLIPFIWMVSTSLMNDLEVYQFPPKFIPSKLLWSNYPEALKALPFDRFFFNSTVTAILVTTGQLFFCSMAAYAFSRIEFPGRNKVFMLYLSTMMIPGVVTLIPSFIIINNFGWIDTFWSEFTIYLKIIVPLSKPALATLGVFTLMGTWRALLWPLIVTRSMKMRTIEVGISASNVRCCGGNDSYTNLLFLCSKIFYRGHSFNRDERVITFLYLEKGVFDEHIKFTQKI